jgi:hypothetical protein
VRWIDNEPQDLDREVDPHKAAAYKTVDIFARIVGRPITLLEGKRAETDLQRIWINFDSPNYYQDAEHELAHVLFRSDPIAKEMFVREYTTRVIKALRKDKIVVSPARVNILAQSIATIINLVEDHRVNSLWGVIYPGSYAIIRAQDREVATQILPKAHENLVNLLLVTETGLNPAPGELDRFRPYCVEALSKAERRGFEATLMVSKWLIGCFVSELIRQEKNQPPATPPKGTPNTCGDQGNQKTQKKKSLWNPPPPKASKQERAEALNKLIDKLGALPEALQKKTSDVQPPSTPATGSTEKARILKDAAMKLDIHKDADVTATLDKSEADMDQVLKAAMDFIGTGMSKDKWIRKEVGARVVFKDVNARDIVGFAKNPLLPEDLTTIRRLRALFNRVMGRRKMILDDHGSALDVGAFIERKLTGHPVPCFRQEVRGRGFKVLVLLDRSGSMYYHKEATERACRILFRALNYPFVDLAIWGWNSLDAGQIDIARYDPKLEVFDSDKSKIAGVTPLHLAVRVGARYLELGSEVKHMILTTDGQPHYQRGDGKHYNGEQLMLFAREDIKRTRRNGVNVTGVIFGSGWEAMDDAQMNLIFGAPRNWKRIEAKRMGPDLVRVVTTNFLSYLRTG